MAPPVTVDDSVLYTPRNLYLDKPVIVTLLDGSQLEIWGPVFVNGNPLAAIGSLPIATQPEAEAGVDNTKVMTPLRTKQSITANAPGGSGAVGSVNGKTGVVVLNQDEVLNGSTYVQYAQTEKTKLAGIATGATANSSDATLLARANHTGTQSADTITDGTTNKTFSAAEDTKLAGIATGATANSSDATLLARANHTGTQSADTITNGSTNKVYTTAEQTKLAGIATGATANSSDATLLARANHTGTQAESTVTNLVTDLAAKVNTSTLIATSAPLTGGGDLASNKTLDISNFTASTKGAVPPPGTATGLFLKDDGTWAAPAGGGSGVTDGDKGDIVVSGSGATWMLDSTVVTAAAKTVLDDASVAAMLTTLGGQPVDADLTTIAGLTATTDNMIQSVGSAWASRTPTQVKTALALDQVNNTTDAGKPVSTAQATAIGLKVDKTTVITATSPIRIDGGASADLSAGRTLSIANDSVTNTQLALMATNTIKGNNTGSTAGPLDLTAAQTKTLLALVKADVGLGNVDNTSDANAPVSTAQQTALDLKVNLNQTINAQTGTSYTLALTDNGKLVTLDNAAAIALTVPTNASAAFPVGSRIDLVQRGVGQVTVGGTPTVNATPTKKTRAQYSGLTLVKELTDTWYLFGDLSAT